MEVGEDEGGGRDGPSTGGAVGMVTRWAFGRRLEVESKKMNSSSSRRNMPRRLGWGVGDGDLLERRRREPEWEK